MRFTRILLLLLLLPAGASFTPGCAESFLLHPSTRPVDGANTRMLAGGLEIASANGDEAALPSALAFIGNASRAEHEAGYWSSLLDGAVGEVSALNYPGYGRSAGSADLDALVPTACAADRELRPALLIGNSMGAAVALGVAAQGSGHRLLILRNVPPLRQLILKRHGWWNLWLLAAAVASQVPSDLDAIDNAARCRMPAIFLIALGDDTVPPAYQQDVVDAYAGPTVVIHYDGRHNARLPPATREELRRAVVELLGR